MSIEMCDRCDRHVDTDFDSIEYIDKKPVCDNCLTEEELETLEEDLNDES